MRSLFLIAAVVGMVAGMVSPRAEDHAEADVWRQPGLRSEKLAKPGGVWAQRRSEAEAAIRAQIHLFASAFNEGNTQALGVLYTRDALLLPRGPTQIEGRDQITRFWEAAIDWGLEDLVLVPVEVVIVDDTAFEIRTLSLSAPIEGGEDRPIETNSIVVWLEDWDGTWRLHRDIWTVIPPMLPLKAPLF